MQKGTRHNGIIQQLMIVLMIYALFWPFIWISACLFSYEIFLFYFFFFLIFFFDFCIIFCFIFHKFWFYFKILGGGSKPGGFKVFGTFRPEHSLNPYEPGKRPVKLPGAVGMCPADNFAHIGKMAAAADICLFHIADHEEANRLLEDTIRAIQVTDSVARRDRVAKTLVLVSTAMTWARTKEYGQNSYPPLLGLSDAASGPDRNGWAFVRRNSGVGRRIRIFGGIWRWSGTFCGLVSGKMCAVN